MKMFRFFRKQCLIPLALIISLVGMAMPARAATPEFANSIPRGGQRGSELLVTFTGNRLDDAVELISHYPGITAKDLKVIDGKKVEATVVIAPDCQLGEHLLRLRCRSGMSYARNFWVSPFPNVAEVEPNDDFAVPQKIERNVTIEAEAKTEETDYYQVSMKKGERLSVEIEGLRINNIPQNIAIDPYVSIFDKDRNELASADGSAMHKQDTILSYLIPADGDYIVEVRDSAYEGRGRYRAHIGTFPRPTSVYPAGGKAGEEVSMTMIGDVAGDYAWKQKLPAVAEAGRFGVYAQRDGMTPPTPNIVRVSNYGNVLEVEPNDANEQATPAGALPQAMNGILSKEGDVDTFKFSAKKGQAFRVQVYAATIGTPIDVVLNIYDAKGKSIGGSDDVDGTKDARLDFTAPEDGDYLVRVQDMLKRGGANYVYRIETEPVVPSLDITMPEMKRNELQYLKQFDVPQGSAYAMVLNAAKKGFSEELAFDIPKLPAGVTAETYPIPKSAGQAILLLKATPEAPLSGGLFDVALRSANPEKPVRSEFVQTVDLVRGPQNGVEYYSLKESNLPVAVVEALQYKVSIDQPKVPIVRNGTLRLKVRAERLNGYDKKINVRFLWNPPGITSPATMTFDEKVSEIEYELNADANAEIGSWKIGVLANSDAGKGDAYCASPLVDLKVEEPFVQMTLNLTTAKQGEAVEMMAGVENLREFPGDAEVQIFGLPAHTTAPTLKLNKETGELGFQIQTTAKTPVGQHKSVFCTVTLTQNGEPIVHRVGMGGTLRVDPAPKEAAPKPAVEAPKVATSEPKAKPLSRLEQLRLEAQKEAGQ